MRKCLKKMLGLGATIIMYAVLLAYQPIDVYGSNILYEYEDNNSYEAANTINLGDSMSGMLETGDDVDYYQITAPASGKIELDFCHTYQDSGADWLVKVYCYNNGEYNELSSTTVDLNANERIALPYIGAVQNGIYYVKVQRCCSGIEGINYAIQTAFLESGYYEKETNDSYNAATDMELNREYSGTINNFYDSDFYRITAPLNGRIELDFFHIYKDSGADWLVKIYMYDNGEYTELSSVTIDLNANERISLPFIGAKKDGVYYVKVERCCSGVEGENYTIKTKFNASDYIERENNDTYSEATDLLFEHSYSGVINNFYDNDYYKIVAPANGVMNLTFIHKYINSGSDWLVRVYRYINGEYRELSNTTIDLNADNIINLPRVQLNKNGVYYVKVERCCSGVEGIPYSLKAKYNANAPANLKATLNRNSVRLVWQGNKDANGYEVYYKVGTSGKYKKLSTTNKTIYTYKKLSKGKTYSFKVRAYQKINGKMYYSSFVSAKTVRV